MNNNNLDQITMRSSKRKCVRIPQKSSVDTSMNIGEVQPLFFKKVIANSKTRVKIGNVVRLAPMVAPTFGQMKLHHNVSFVGMSDLINSDVYNAYLVGKPVSFTDGVTQVPKYLPCVSLKLLSVFALVGAKWTAYLTTATDDSAQKDSVYSYFYDAGGRTGDVGTHMTSPRWVGATTNNCENFLLHLGGVNPISLTPTQIEDYLYKENDLWVADASTKTLMRSSISPFANYDGSAINVGKIIGLTEPLWIPCANFEMPTFLQPTTASSPDANTAIKNMSGYKAGLMNLEPVTYDNYDFLFRVAIPYPTNKFVYVSFAVKLSDFGARFFKILNALGYGIDFASTREVDLTRICALYKSWFDSFGITLYQGWETTNCKQFTNLYDSSYVYNWTNLIDSYVDDGTTSTVNKAYNIFFSLLRDVTDIWFTEEQDYVTAHQRQAAVSNDNGIIAEFGLSGTPNVNNWGLNIGDGQNDDEASSIAGQWNVSGHGHSYISQVLHSQLDSEVLKRLYKVTNRNTIAGRRIADLLKAQGLGEYVKQCRSHFIGHSAVDIEIFDVTATADSMNSKDDVSSILGEYVGKGVGEGNSKWMVAEAYEVGYVIDLGAIVPESGWMNGVDLTAFDIRPSQQYQPEFDALGLEISPKSIITGVQDSFDLIGKSSVNGESYGFIPRFTRYKVARNVSNGAFALRSVRASFLPYTLDKFVDVGNRVLLYPWVDNNSSQNSASAIECKLLTPSKLPIASPVYRYLGRYPWMSQFMRIFSEVGRDASVALPSWFESYDPSTGDSEVSWFITRTDDPFNVHNVYLIDYWASVLPIEDSYETHDDGNNGPTDMAIGKA